jgi:RNA polymerase sigma-70 factor (ECF subfamily)
MRPSPALVERSRDALARLLRTAATFDVAAVEALLAEDARAMSDGGGEFLAARVPVVGRTRVAKLLVGLAKHSPRMVGYEVRILNGLPALVVEVAPERERVASRYVLRCEIDAAGLVTGVHTVLATRKLTRVRPIARS